MTKSTKDSKSIGNIGIVIMLLGLLGFFIGIFGGPRVFAFIGLGMMLVSMVAFYIEEQQNRRLA